MKQFCHKCLTNNMEEGSCSNCGYAFSSTINERVEDLIYESAISRMAATDEQEKAIGRLERKLAKLELRLDGAKMVDSTFKAIVSAGGQMYHISVDERGDVYVDATKVDPRKEDTLIGIFKAHQKLAEQPKEEVKEEKPTKKEDYPAIQPQAETKKFKKKIKESIDVKNLPRTIQLFKGDQKAEVMPNGTFWVSEKLYGNKWQTIRHSNEPRYIDDIVKELEGEGFTKQVNEEVVTDIGLVEDSAPEIVDQAIKAGFDKEKAGRFYNFMADRFGKSYYDPSYTQEWIDRIKFGKVWANADGMTKGALKAAGFGVNESIVKEDVSQEAPKTDQNPDAQLITDQDDENDDEEFGKWSVANKAEKKYGRDFGVYVKDLINKRYLELVKAGKLDQNQTDFGDFEYEVRKALEEL